MSYKAELDATPQYFHQLSGADEHPVAWAVVEQETACLCFSSFHTDVLLISAVALFGELCRDLSVVSCVGECMSPFAI
jgi:hypothetical protein